MDRYAHSVMLGLVAAAAIAVPSSAFAQERYVPCAPDTRTVNEVAAQVAVNDFDGVEQIVAGAAYSFSTCIGESQNRFRAELSAAHVRQDGYRANVALLGVGVELHPLPSHPRLIVVPMALVGRESLPLDRENLVFGGSLIVSNSFPLAHGKRVIGSKDVSVVTRELILDIRTDYVDRQTSSAGTTLPSLGAETTFYGAIALDQEIGASRWKVTGRAGYRTMDNGPGDGFATLSLGLRRMNKNYSNYGWTAQLAANFGDAGYRAVLLGASFRFGGRPAKD